MSKLKLKLKITTPERVLLEEEVEEIVVPTKTGQLTILPNHQATIAEIVPGEMIVRHGKDEKIALVFGGFIYIKEGSEVTILADSAQHLNEINEKEAEEARKRAEALMKDVQHDKAAFAEAEAELVRSLARLKIVKKHRTHKNIKLN